MCLMSTKYVLVDYLSDSSFKKYVNTVIILRPNVCGDQESMQDKVRFLCYLSEFQLCMCIICVFKSTF
jgi:hypothetical protein